MMLRQATAMESPRPSWSNIRGCAIGICGSITGRAAKGRSPMALTTPFKEFRVRAALQGLALAAAVVLLASQPARAEEDVWPSLKGDLFGDREIQDGAGWVALDAPYRAEDAAIVPIGIRIGRPADADDNVKAVTLVIDQNPAPVAAVIRFDRPGVVTAVSTRIRVNAYSHVRAIAETVHGRLYMATKFVKASGGCSAPASKDREEAMANLGKMRLRQFSPERGTAADASVRGLREAQLMIRHPNYSGLQMDQITRTYTPAYFVRDVDVRLGGARLFTVEGAISLSENPSFRFLFLAPDGDSLSARVEDTEGHVFSDSWRIERVARSGS